MRQHLMSIEMGQRGIPPSLERMRWALYCRYRRADPVPFSWLLQSDIVPQATLRRAKTLASMALPCAMTGDGVSIGGCVTPEQFKWLWKFGA